ncbi:GTP 3',8-cyclase MoaA [Candidatus Aminicenantes bacterium AC-708-M15]|nr:GTP 3',8-cyclase MoaA [SCandidatus Aminicenantes bacterium Aminicenantia_JdfR_composite]MCP2597253.1 GTP 3',8-cyclase MoaA [Candidatus Aminicenantes bacterium AC-335-G13]MCP2604194.1 GTP 3',8-cyclase MoaA [Candidatus Aminicenantes bacterium AC-708-M15]MCP2618733.1 GTP 3',8-cyclase MoaA [Candidatus Aminicenantes bacterium AC-335-A11]
MEDKYKRKINYMRISVTDRCNLNCIYCTPSKNPPSFPPSEILTYEEILRLMKIAVNLGIKKFRITGGEPLLRKNLPDFITKALSIKGIEDFSLTTNGILLGEFVNELWNAGLRRINISLDTLDEEKYREITQGGDLKKVLNSLEKAINRGFDPIKINVVLLKGINENISPFIKLAMKYPVYIRFIELMNTNHKNKKFFLSGENLRLKLIEYGEIIEVNPPQGGGPAKYYKLSGIKKSIGFIFPYSDHFCLTCNRLRISSDGKLRPCLFSEWHIDLKTPLRQGFPDEKIKKIIINSLMKKPVNRQKGGRENRTINMREVGG